MGSVQRRRSSCASRDPQLITGVAPRKGSGSAVVHGFAMNDAIDIYVPEAEWSAVDAAIVQIGRTRAEQDFEEGRWLLAARRCAVHTRLGFATFSEYVERRLGHDPRTTAEKLRVASALADLPLLRESLRTGRRPWTAVRELVRVAVPKTEAEWISATEQKSVRDVERMVAGSRPGDGPNDPKDPALRKHPVRLEMTPELYARFREATDRIRKEVDASLSDEEAVAAMVDRVLGGPADAGRSPYQVSVTVCEHCGRTWQRTRGQLREVEAEVGERAYCDGQLIGSVPAPDATHVGARAQAELQATHVGEARALQTVSPRLRRTVFARAHGRCQVDGCTNTRYLDIHHITPRAEGGHNDEDTCMLACGTHHRLLHQGRLLVEGSPRTGLRFMHADRTAYGATPPTPRETEDRREAQQALRALGLDGAEAKALLANAVREVGGEVPAAELVRVALRIRGRGLAAKYAPANAAHDGPARWSGDYARVLTTLAVAHSLTRDRAA
jgi:hypothetical protein